ncbi:hypothetical protein CNY89_12215 [Amaricoccus sp. HAR-UPW-R2A-40]|nr:hypothetical protein CNY89_12215 [Amaricoccus sp. HAR-UPW-R2A-40]
MPVNACDLAEDVTIRYPDLVNLYGCAVGEGSQIGPFVEIQKGSRIGARCKISSHSFVCEGVTIEDEVFVGHGVMFTNGLLPRATNLDGSLQRRSAGATPLSVSKRSSAEASCEKPAVPASIESRRLRA